MIRAFAAFGLLGTLGSPLWAEVVVPGAAQIVILGEIHDNPEHHATQARLVAKLKPHAVVWEMLTKAQLDAARGVDRQDAAAYGAALGWEAAGWPDFAMYHPIFLAAGDVPQIGASVPRADLKDAMARGAGPVSGLPLPPFPPAVQAALEDEQAVAHCGALPKEVLPKMVEAQRLRDAAMAKAAAQAVKDYGAPVVIITGTGHARTDTGIPAVLRDVAPDLRVWSLGQTEGDAGVDAPFDAVTVTAPTPRADPCLGFKAP